MEKHEDKKTTVQNDQQDDQHDPDQAYFWTPEWQAKEREADEDIAAGRYEEFSTVEDMLADLMDDDEESD